jgi:hypothetical protein
MSNFLNVRAIKRYVAEKSLRVSKEFTDELGFVVREKIDKAISRNRSFGRKTLKKDELYA